MESSQISIPSRLSSVAARSRGARLVLLGLTTAFASLLWLFISFHLNEDRRADLSRAETELRNLARAFAEHVAGSVNAIDNALTIIRMEYSRLGPDLDLSRIHAELLQSTPLFSLLSIADQDGNLIHSSLPLPATTINIAHSSPFKAVQAGRAGLNVSEPMMGRISKRWSLYFSRRLEAADGSFLGAVQVAVDPYLLANRYLSVNLGMQGYISLSGLDGIIRFIVVGEDHTRIGLDISATPLTERARQQPAGTFVDNGTVGNIRRIVGFQAIPDVGLVVSVGRAVDEILASHESLRERMIAFGLALSLLGIGATAWILRQMSRLAASEQDLRRSEARFCDGIGSMVEAFILCDAQDRIVAWNKRCYEIFPGSEAWLARNRPFAELAEELARSPLLDLPEPERPVWVAKRLERHAQPGLAFQFRLADGRTIEVAERRTHEGGVVTTARDVTAEAQAVHRLAVSEARYRDFTAASADWHWETNETHVVTYVSPTPSGRPHRSLAVGSDLLLTFDRVAPAVAPRLHELMEARQAVRDIEVLIDDGSEPRWRRFSAVPVDSAGVFRGYRGVVTDIDAAKRTAAELARQSDFMATAQKLARIAWWRRHRATDNYEFSPTYLELVGLPATTSDLSVDFVKSMVHPEDRDRFLDPRTHRPGEVTNELRHIKPNGEIVHLLSLITIPEDPEGWIFGISQDVTALRTQEQAVQRMSVLLVEAAKVGQIGYYERDIASGRYVMSDEMYALLGLTPGDAAPSREVIKELVLPEDRARLDADSADPSWLHRETEIRIRQPSGELRYLLVRRQREFDANGRVIRHLGAVQDITQRKLSEIALRESESRFRDFALAASDWLWETSADGRVTFVSSAVDRALGLPIQTLIWDFDETSSGSTSDQDDRDEVMTARAARREFQNLLVRRPLPSGETLWLRVSGNPRFDASGGFLGYRGVVKDVTQIRQATQVKARDDRMHALGRLAGGVAHEINNLLQPIVALGEKTRASLPSDHKALPWMTSVVQCGLQARDIVREILTFSRAEQKSLRPLQFVSAVQEALDFARGIMPASLIIEQHLPAFVGDALIDQTQLNEILVNLLANARDATGENGHVVVMVSERGADLGKSFVLAVSDDGPGMDEATLKQAFNPFFTTKPIGSGTGLGLSVVYGIIKNWNGDVSASSKPGIGTTIEIVIPAAPVECEV